MKRLFKILLITLAVLAAGLFGGAWYLNRWVQAPETRAYVETELSKALKMPLKFRSLSISVLGGLRAEGVSVQDGGTQFFDSSSFTAKHRIMPLFSGDFVFKEITVDAPRFVVVQRPDGSWKLPELPEGMKEEKPKSDPDKPKEKGTPKPKKKKSGVVVEKIVVTNGQAEFFDKDHKPVLSVTGLRIGLQDVRADHLEGRVTAAQVVWHGGFGITDFGAGVHNSKEKGLIVPQFSAKTGGGTITGGFARKPEKPPKYSAKLKIEDVDIGAATMAGGVPAPNLTGLLSANIDVRGTGNDLKKLDGKASLAFRNGTCREIEMIKELGLMLQLDEVANFGIPEATAEVVIWNGRFKVNPLAISAPPLGLSAAGTVRENGKLDDCQATLLVDARYVARNPAVASQFSAPDANGMQSLTFDLSGTITKPKHNLQERITGTKDKRLQRVMIIDAAASAILEELQPPSPGGKKPPKP